MEPVILTRGQHCISRRDIDRNALSILYRLRKYGFKAYLVGGSVRDLLLGRTPKDFDIVTDARPSRVRRLFRNSFLVGRRFRLVHIKFKNKIIEVSTFRRTPPRPGNGELFLRRENAFGTPEEDAYRRDFTVNGLFYDIRTFCVIDYVGGLNDLKQGCIRTIGNPEIRFQEDPVRMIRAVRIAGRTGFYIDTHCLAVMKHFKHHILKCAPARNLEEMHQLLRYQAAAPSVKLLYETGLMEVMLPELTGFWDSPELASEAAGLLERLDRYPPEHPYVTLPVRLAALLFPLVMVKSDGLKPGRDLRCRVEESIRNIAARFRLPRRHFDRLTHICLGQRWFSDETRPRRFRPSALIRRNFFPETLMFAAIRFSGNTSKWTPQKQLWRKRLISADIDPDYRRELMRILTRNPGKRKIIPP